MSLDKIERRDRANAAAAYEVALNTPLSETDARRLAVRLAKAEDSGLAMLAAAYEMGMAVGVGSLIGRRTCRICGCWELAACPGGCSWIGPDLCSACALGHDLGAAAVLRLNPLLCEEC